MFILSVPASWFPSIGHVLRPYWLSKLVAENVSSVYDIRRVFYYIGYMCQLYTRISHLLGSASCRFSSSDTWQLVFYQHTGNICSLMTVNIKSGDFYTRKLFPDFPGQRQCLRAFSEYPKCQTR